MKITAEDYKTYGVNLLKSFEEYAAKQPGFYPVANNYEGIRVSIRDKKVTGWMLLRVSLHDPLMPMNIEADTKDGVNVITNRLMPFLEKQKQLDITSLK